MKKLVVFLALAAAAAVALQFKVDGGPVLASTAPAPASETAPNRPPGAPALEAFSDAPPGRPVPVLFIHHSCGGQLLAPAGPEREHARCIYVAHPNGGGLRDRLVAAQYQVNEASYGSRVGDKTDLFDWLPKFRDQMPAIVRVQRNDTELPAGQRNEVVVFKSCYTESHLEGPVDGTQPGNPAGPELTLANARATLSALLPEFQKHPDTLFVYVTSPPLAAWVEPVPAWKFLARKVLGKPDERERLLEKGRLARALTQWLRAPDGWLAGYPGKNVVVFDYYEALTVPGTSGLSSFPTEGGRDSHPSSAGNQRAAEAFVPFLNRALRYAGRVTP